MCFPCIAFVNSINKSGLCKLTLDDESSPLIIYNTIYWLFAQIFKLVDRVAYNVQIFLAYV